jgi:N-acetylglucosaminyltransferase 3, mucin type
MRFSQFFKLRLLTFYLIVSICLIGLYLYQLRNDQHIIFHSFRYPVSCIELFEGDENALTQARLWRKSNASSAARIADQDYIFDEDQCSLYRQLRFSESYHQRDTPTNEQFPLAFTMLLYNNVEQFERLLRLIYRPQNVYCIHLDTNAATVVHEAIQSIARCFPNVFLVSQPMRMMYATITRLYADLNCMKDLVQRPGWKYLLNVASSELPLQTNSEMVRILKIYRGFNDIEGVWKEKNRERTDFAWTSVNVSQADRHSVALQRTDQKKKPPPGKLEIVKGSAYGERWISTVTELTLDDTQAYSHVVLSISC